MSLFKKLFGDVNAEDDDGWTQLMFAARRGELPRVKMLIARSADVNVKNNSGDTALIMAAGEGHTECVKALIAARADMNIRNSMLGWTALMSAAGKGHTDCVKALIAAGADINAKSHYGHTALMSAAEKDRTDCVKALIAAGADISAKDKNGFTALWQATTSSHSGASAILRDAEARLQAQSTTGRGLEIQKDAQSSAAKSSTSSVNAKTGRSSTMKYMQVSGNHQDPAYCSDDACPCGLQGAPIPRGKGYVYVSKEIVDFRDDCLTEAELERKIERMSAEFNNAVLVGASGVFVPILMCERGARKRGLDLEVAAADAKHWWATGQVPLRPTPLAPASGTTQYPSRESNGMRRPSRRRGSSGSYGS